MIARIPSEIWKGTDPNKCANVDASAIPKKSGNKYSGYMFQHITCNLDYADVIPSISMAKSYVM